MNDKSDAAVEKFLSGYNCAQSILFAHSAELGLDNDAALKVACGFGAGMGRRGEVCGAVTGGIMAIGMKYGRGAQGERAATDQTYLKTRELMSRFEKSHGSCICRELLGGCDLSTPEGQRFFKENDLLHKTCVRCVKTVAEVLADIMTEPEAVGPGPRHT